MTGPVNPSSDLVLADSQYTLRELLWLMTITCVACALGLLWVAVAIWIGLLAFGYLAARRSFFALMRRSPLPRQQFV